MKLIEHTTGAEITIGDTLKLRDGREVRLIGLILHGEDDLRAIVTHFLGNLPASRDTFKTILLNDVDLTLTETTL